MQQEKLAERYIREFKYIVKEGIKKGNLEFDETDKNANYIMGFSQINQGKGKLVYQSFSDEELCEILKNLTREKGHVPAQKELHWLYRVYIKRRFGNWPKALLAAGLSKKAGKCGDTYEKIKIKKQLEKNMLDEVRQKANELGRPPHMHEMEDVAEKFKSKFSTWAELLEAAGIDTKWKNWEPVYKVEILSNEDMSLLKNIYDMADELGRPPMRREVSSEIRQKLKKSCGTWRNILYQVGLEPIQKIKPFSITYLDGRRNVKLKHNEILEGSLFKLVNPSGETAKCLKILKQKSDKLGRPLIKDEIPTLIYDNLIKQCVNYRNILYQVGLEPLEKSRQKEIERELRRKAKTGL